MVPSACGSSGEWEPQHREKEVAAAVSLGSLLFWPGVSVFRGGLGSSTPLVSLLSHPSLLGKGLSLLPLLL